MENQGNAVVSAVNSLLSSAASDATGMITTNLPVIGGVVVAVALMSFGFKLIGRIRRGN